jgi:hypothetical protein
LDHCIASASVTCSTESASQSAAQCSKPFTETTTGQLSLALTRLGFADFAFGEDAPSPRRPVLWTTNRRPAEKIAETRFAGLKEVEPKLQAFYDSLDAKQKKAFDAGGRGGGVFEEISKPGSRTRTCISLTRDR